MVEFWFDPRIKKEEKWYNLCQGKTKMSAEELRNKEKRHSGEQFDGGEQQRSMDWLVKHGEWDSLKGNEEYQSLSIKGRILIAKKAVTQRLVDATKVFGEVVREDTKAGAKFVKEELNPLRNLIKSLNARYVGELNPKEAPEEMTKTLNIPARNLQPKTV